MISFDDFRKIEIRIGTIVSAEKVEGADKLLKLEVDLGTEKRQLVAGIALEYDPGSLAGKQVPVLVNLEPKTIMGVESHGMMLIAVDDGKPVLLHPGRDVSPGTQVR